jgi:hypothetical protein
MRLLKISPLRLALRNHPRFEVVAGSSSLKLASCPSSFAHSAKCWPVSLPLVSRMLGLGLAVNRGYPRWPASSLHRAQSLRNWTSRAGGGAERLRGLGVSNWTSGDTSGSRMSIGAIAVDGEIPNGAKPESVTEEAATALSGLGFALGSGFDQPKISELPKVGGQSEFGAGRGSGLVV